MLDELNTNYWKLLLYNWYTTSSSHLNILALFTNTLHVIFANNFWTFAAFSFQFIVQFLPFKLIIISTSNIFHKDVTTASICCWKISGFIYLNTQNLPHFVDKNGRKVRRVLIAALHMGGTNNFPKVWVNSNEDSVAGLDNSARIVFALVRRVSKTNARALTGHLWFFILFVLWVETRSTTSTHPLVWS